MSTTIDNQIESLLAGESVQTEDTVDSDDAAQHNIVKSRGNQAPSHYVPICQKTVTYVVIAVVINDRGEVLMIQEAKPCCKGQWYLPAGRVEPNESLLDAVKREVLEETGLILEPKTLILVECATGSWFRFVFTGDIVGGSIKTLEQSNEESLQASWVRDIEELSLRSNDIVSLIERGKNYVRDKRTPQHPHLMPVATPLSKLLLRLMIICKKRTTNRLHVLVSAASPPHLPMCEINPSRSYLSTLHGFMVEIFGSGVELHRPHGLFSVEFSGGRGGDGLCLTTLVAFLVALEDVSVFGKYVWHELSENVAASVISRVPRHMTVPMNDVH